MHSTSVLKRKRHTAAEYLDWQEWEDLSESDLDELRAASSSPLLQSRHVELTSPNSIRLLGI